MENNLPIYTVRTMGISGILEDYGKVFESKSDNGPLNLSFKHAGQNTCFNSTTTLQSDISCVHAVCTVPKFFMNHLSNTPHHSHEEITVSASSHNVRTEYSRKFQILQ